MVMDWVVNDDTYSITPVAVPNGDIVALPLVYPRHVLQEATTWNSPGGYAFPDAGRQFVKAVRGQVVVIPGTWAVGSSFRMMMRIVKKPMDFTTGEAVADALYDLYAAAFANERFCWQHLKNEFYNLGNAWEVMTVRATVNQWLEPDEGLYFIAHNQSGITQTLVLNTFLRTLVSAEGA